MTVDISIILDRSGSMGCIEEQVVASFNDFLHEQKKVKGEATISMVQFDHEYTVHYTAIDIQKAKDLNEETYMPRGSTALLDAIGRTIVSTKERLSKDKEFGFTPHASSGRKVVIVITTDGMENASEEYRRKQIQSMIKKCEDKLDWKFIYLAADDASFEQHADFGMNSGRAFKMGRGKKAYSHANKIMSAKMTAWRDCGSTEELDFTEEERINADHLSEN